MRIKLAILENDANYLRRIVSAFQTKYADKLEIYSFTDKDVAVSTLDSAKIDVFVADDSFDIDTNALPKRCGFAYFVDSLDTVALNDQYAICKFQKADLIYKQILSLYSETSGAAAGIKLGDDSAKIFAFQPVSGGCGASTMAAACAIHFASGGKRVLYLNLEKTGSADSFFSAEGQFDMSDIIFALKSKKANLALKLESCVKQDACGVNFFSQPKLALDMMELNTDDLLRLIGEIKLSATYDFIILDLDFALNEDMFKILRQTYSVVWVGDGSDISNTKLFRAYTAIATMEQNADAPLTNRLCLAYNKFSNKTCKTLDGIGIKNIGGAPRYEHATTAQVLEQLAPMGMFDKII